MTRDRIQAKLMSALLSHGCRHSFNNCWAWSLSCMTFGSDYARVYWRFGS
jgi:hypothetical protein